MYASRRSAGPSACPASYTVTMCSCSSRAASCASRRNRSTAEESSRQFGRIIFRADLAAIRRCLGAVDDAHPPLADRRDQVVVADVGPRRRSSGRPWHRPGTARGTPRRRLLAALLPELALELQQLGQQRGRAAREIAGSSRYILDPGRAPSRHGVLEAIADAVDPRHFHCHATVAADRRLATREVLTAIGPAHRVRIRSSLRLTHESDRPNLVGDLLVRVQPHLDQGDLPRVSSPRMSSSRRHSSDIIAANSGSGSRPTISANPGPVLVAGSRAAPTRGGRHAPRRA